MYKVGDKVKIRYNLESIQNKVFVVRTMIKYEGKIATITELWGNFWGDPRYHIDLDEECFTWEDCLFEPVGTDDLVKYIRSLLCTK